MPSGGFRDFSLLPLGVGFRPPPIAGFINFIEFAGMYTGQAIVPPPAPPATGFVGFLDFVGYGVAQGTGAVIPPARGHGFRGAGKYTEAALRIIQERRRWIKEQRKIHRFPPVLLRDLITQRVVMNQWEKERVHQKQLTETAIYSVLLAEL